MFSDKVCVTELKRKIMLYALLAAFAAVISIGAFFMFRFVLGLSPKIYDENVLPGLPDIQDGGDGYTEIAHPDVCTVYICQKPVMINGSGLRVYLTNPAGHSYSVKIEIYEVVFYKDEEGNVTYKPGDKIGQSDFVKSGSYLEYVKVKGKQTENEKPLLIKIAARDDSSGVSLGYFMIQASMMLQES